MLPAHYCRFASTHLTVLGHRLGAPQHTPHVCRPLLLALGQTHRIRPAYPFWGSSSSSTALRGSKMAPLTSHLPANGCRRIAASRPLFLNRTAATTTFLATATGLCAAPIASVIAATALVISSWSCSSTLISVILVPPSISFRRKYHIGRVLTEPVIQELPGSGGLPALPSNLDSYNITDKGCPRSPAMQDFRCLKTVSECTEVRRAGISQRVRRDRLRNTLGETECQTDRIAQRHSTVELLDNNAVVGTHRRMVRLVRTVNVSIPGIRGAPMASLHTKLRRECRDERVVI
jgi:hypothetical protein